MKTHIKTCLECGEFFLAQSKQLLCSESCRKVRDKRQRREYYYRKKLGAYKPNFINEGKPKFTVGQTVKVCPEVHQHKYQERKIKAKVVKSYKSFVLCQLKNYKECFSHEDIDH